MFKLKARLTEFRTCIRSVAKKEKKVIPLLIAYRVHQEGGWIEDVNTHRI